MTAAAPLPQLIAEVPGALRVETQVYGSPAAHLGAPPAELCSREQLLEIAANATSNRARLWALLGSPEHVRRICELVCAETGMADLDRELEGCRMALAEERDGHQVAILEHEQLHDLYEAELAERVRVAGLNAELSALLVLRTRERDQAAADNVHLRHQRAGTTPAAVQVALARAARLATAPSTDCPTAEPDAQLSPVPDGIVDDDADTVVVDVPLARGGAR